MGKTAKGIAVCRGTMSESFDFVFERANSALLTQDFEYAEWLLTNVLTKHPDISPEDKEKIENLLARIYGDKGNPERSLEAYLRLYEREPDNLQLMLSIGRVYRHLCRYEDALNILQKARDIGGDTNEVLYSFAKTYKQMRNYDKAAGYFLRAIELKPDHAHAYDRLGNLYVLTGETDKAIEIYKKGLRIDPNHPYLNFHLAGLLRQEKRYDEAVVYYNSALRINPAWIEVLAGIAVAYLQLDKLDEALNTYRSLLRITGENAPLYTQLGYLFEKKQLQQEAEQYYHDALAIDSGYAPAALALTRLLEKKQLYTEALPLLLAAEAVPVNAANHALRLKAIQMCMYAKDYAKALELFGRLDAEHSNSLNALKLRGQLYALTGEREQAEQTFKKILQTTPAAIEFRQELAEQYLMARKYKEAKEQLELFLRQRPIDIPALMALGRTEELLNNPQAAYQEYQKVLELKPDAIEARSALSRLFQKRGDTIEALKTANEIINLQSGSETDEHEQDMAASLDLYEQAAESYTTDPLLTKNLEQLKPDDSSLYMSPAELSFDSDLTRNIPSLRDISKSEQDLPFEMLIEGTEEVKELPPEKDDISIATMQLNDEMQNAMLPRAVSSNYVPSPAAPYADSIGHAGTAMPSAAVTGNPIGVIPALNNTPPITDPRTTGSSAFSSPIDELYLNPDNTDNNAALDIGGISQKNAQALQKLQNLIRDEATQERLKEIDTHGTSIGFLQDIISDIDKQFDENRYAQAVEVLAERIAENLSRKIPLQPAAPTEEPEEQELQSEPQELEETEEMFQTEEAEGVWVTETQESFPMMEEAGVPIIETQEEDIFSLEHSQEVASETADSPILDLTVEEEPVEPEYTEPDAKQENDITVIDGEDELFFEATEEEVESERETEAEPEVDLESDTEVVLEPEVDSEHEFEVEADFEPDEDVEVETEAEFEPEDDVEVEPESEFEPEDDVEVEPESEFEPEEDVEVEPESEFEPEEDVEVETEAEFEPEEDVGVEEEPSHNSDSFVLDQGQQNLLWCHAKHRIKDSPLFEQYLNTTDPEQLVQLFLYLRDLFTYLPKEELNVFLNSSERLQIYYIIARLSGELGLKERANLIQQACAVTDAEFPYDEEAVLKLLTYLCDLSAALPDQELGTMVRQELEQLMTNMSSVFPNS